ncbi:hypothetical protein LB524_01240 [Mesorhizobium sp. ESP6-5]|uniref:hypothetical protein n=1 Tax=unclassified Mesorhizobium TaxID=325217 RepID=UPI001CCFBD26|nr:MULTISPECIES: hypothetical protein [unclassified Mesorhizobium]MBZ9753899.1 hypothetical protein [Mesorhizobium sp. ESP6-5]MBZ9908626.1 hypothetical protein [Mesorhizobium sp. BR115XR7A]MBZ9933230.1 hypothetical protein [Mesorhizobium sp. BR1-1-5]
MSNVARFPNASSKSTASQETVQAEQTLALIKTLLGSLPAAQRDLVARELLKVVGTPDSPKAGDVLSSVVSLMKHREEFTVAEVRQHVEDRVGAAPKEVYNALGYLTRKGRLKRIGYGRYEVDGVGLSTSDDLGGEMDRHEDLSDDER